MYEVFGSAKTRAFRVVWMLEELGQPFTLHDIGPRSDAALELNPSGKIPSMKDGDTALTDSAAIITYLADKHGSLTAPAGTLKRAQQDAMTHLILDEFDAVLWTAARHSFILPEEHRIPAVKDSLKWEFGVHADRLNNRMTDAFVMGEDMTVPDILLTHCLTWAMGAKFDVSQTRLRDYVDRMRERPAYKRAFAYRE